MSEHAPMFANLKKRFLVMALIVMMLGVPIAAFSTSLASGAVSTFPYYQGFESGSANAVINEANWGSNQWYYKASQKHSGSLSAGAAITTTGDDTRRLFVNVDFSGKVCASISYWYRITSVDTTVRLMRLIGSNNGGNTWFVLRDWTNISNATSWTQFSADQNLSMFTNHSNCCIKIQVKCLSGHNQRTLYVDDFCITVVNHAPTTPTPFGPISGYTGTSYTYSTSATDPDGDQVRYYFSWGDGTTGTWTGWVSSGSTASASHSWSSPGTYYVMAKAQDIHGADSAVSSSLTVAISNRPPNTPSTPSGPTSGYTGTSYTYSTSATDPDGNQVRYYFNWGDGTGTWTGWVSSGSTVGASHSWSSLGTYYVKAYAQDYYGAVSGWSSSLTVAISNRPPNTPSKPSGPTSGYTGTSYTYSTSATDPDGDQVKYCFDWGDGTTKTWTGFVSSGVSASASHSWSSPGTYYVKAKAQDYYGAESGYSSSLTVAVVISSNNEPNTPNRPSGETLGYVGPSYSYSYSTSTTDPDGDSVRYWLWWDDDTGNWTNWVSSGSSASASHSWSSPGTYYVRAQAQDIHGAYSSLSSSLNVTIVNRLPNTPSTPSGPTSVCTGTSYTYSTRTTDPDTNQTRYYFDWGDGTWTWTDWLWSGSTAYASHSWCSGTYYVKAKAQDTWGGESGWSNNLKVVADDDGNPTEVGVWALGDLGQWWWDADLLHAVPSAQDFYDVLVGAGFTGRYTLFNEANVWGDQFRDFSWTGGEDYIYADSCDFIYVTTHGDRGSFVVGTSWWPWVYDTVTLYDHTVSWGDLDMEWAFISACSVLDGYAYGEDLGEISPAFDGKLHGIAGYASISRDALNEGYYLARYATGQEYITGMGYTPLTIGEAWERASKQTQYDYVIGAIVAGNKWGINYEDEYLPGYCSGMLPDPNSIDLHGHWWTCCG